jgi:5-methylcytosine-specific restriction protein A
MNWPTTSRHLRGYGTEHDKMRALLMRTVILCEECIRQGRSTRGTIAEHILSLARAAPGSSTARARTIPPDPAPVPNPGTSLRL